MACSRQNKTNHLVLIGPSVYFLFSTPLDYLRYGYVELDNIGSEAGTANGDESTSIASSCHRNIYNVMAVGS